VFARAVETRSEPIEKAAPTCSAPSAANLARVRSGDIAVEADKP
jgi:hypothetical protein